MLGIDVSKEKLACALLNQETEQFLWQRSFPNSEAGLRHLLQQTPASSPWLLEPTGRYSLFVAKAARAAGRTVLLAPTKKAKAYLASRTSRAKTDRVDSCGLALFAASRLACEPLPPYPIKSEAVERLDQLMTARRSLVDAQARLQQQMVELPHATDALQAALAALHEQERQLDRQIAAQLADPALGPDAAGALKRLRAVPGIGPVTAAALVSRLTSRHFAHADQFVAYVGLDIATIRSGKREGQRGLTKHGDAELRRLLFMCAQATAFRPSSPFHPLYTQELARGRPKTAALCIVARKLARLCWSIVHHGTDYDPNRLFQQAPPPGSTGCP